MRAGFRFDGVRIYARSRDLRKRGDRPCRMTLYLDNLEIAVRRRVQAPGAKTKSYTCHNNPPLFDWFGPTRRGIRLEYSRDPSFPPEVTTSVVLESTYPFYVPPTLPAPGTWYFRREIASDLVVGWSATQPVVIPERTHHYRLSPIDMDAVRKRPHPRFRVLLEETHRELTEVRRVRLLQYAVTEAKKGVPEHPGPYKPGDPRWPNWIDWYGSVADKITARTGRRLKRVAEAAMLTGAPEALDAARRLLVEACKWDPDGGSAERHGDLQAAALLQGMVWCWDVCSDRLTPDERRVALDVIRRRVLQFYERISPFRLNPAQNHSWKRNTVVAETALALMGDLPEAPEWLATAAHNFAYRILPSMGFDGEDAEGLPYWNYGVNMLANCADLLRFVAGVDVYDHPWLRRTCRFPVYCAPPNAYAVSFADNSHRGNASLVGPFGTRLVAWLGSRVHDPCALWYADVHDPVVTPRPPADVPQSICWPYIGYALFHTCLSEGLEDVAVGLRSGPYYAGHQHADNNGFVIHAYGDKLAVDGGYYDWYGSPHFKAYSIQTIAHNTLLVDGHGQKKEADGALRDFFDSPNFGYVVGDASNPEIYGKRLSRFERRVLFVKPAFVVVHDLIATDGRPRRVDWLLHAHTSDPFPADSAARTFEIRRPRAALFGTFLLPARLGLAVKKSFDVPPQKPRASVFLPWSEVQPEWTLWAAPERPFIRDDVFAVMEVVRGEAPKRVPSLVRRITSKTTVGCELRTPYGTCRLISRRIGAPAEAPIRGLDLECDGDAAAVLMDGGGRVLDAFAARATFVRFKGRRVSFYRRPAEADADRTTGALVDWKGGVESCSAPVDMDGRGEVLEGRIIRYAAGPLGVWWGTVRASKIERCRLRIIGWTGARPPHVRVNGSTRQGTDVTVVLRPGLACLTISGEGRFRRAILERLQYRIAPAERISGEVTPGPEDVLIDADAPGPFAQSEERQGRVMKKVAAHGGTAFCCIDGPVQWAEWRFTIPRDGRYELLVRAAGAHETVDREVRVDGTAFPEEGVAVRMRGTGGWCRTTNDWAWERVLTPDGKAATVHLRQGAHTLRWEYLDGSQNIDVFMFRRVR